ncbi:unnamed protein product [Thelazia callipaeda]|uniref:LEM domain-containing protein n=1 Tax=Thelazia callipaeda TaxID=103827 RepID=A0A0N5CYC3_THECL|nr:unnamed protein product [Thelazia callipaeda]
MVSLKQEFHFYDYLGPIAVALLFAIAVLLISFFVLNFFFISKYDDPTVFERLASKHNLRLGPHDVQTVISRKHRYMKNNAIRGSQKSFCKASDKPIHNSQQKVEFTSQPIPEVCINSV